MEKYKEKLKKQQILLIIVGVLATILYVALRFIFKDTTTDKEEFYEGFRTGTFVTLIVFLIILIINNLIVLKNDLKLRKKYIEFSDERKREILYLSVLLQQKIFPIAILLAMIVASFINSYIFFTLLFIQLFMALSLKIIRTVYSRRI